MPKINDPKKKTKIRVNSGAFKSTTVITGSGAALTRDDKGKLVAHRDENYAGVSAKSIREDREKRKNLGDRTFDGMAAPRAGGGEKMKKGPQASGGTKKMMIKSMKRVRKSDASPQAKQAAMRILKMKK